jgi:hypothetical protein
VRLRREGDQGAGGGRAIAHVARSIFDAVRTHGVPGVDVLERHLVEDGRDLALVEIRDGGDGYRMARGGCCGGWHLPRSHGEQDGRQDHRVDSVSHEPIVSIGSARSDPAHPRLLAGASPNAA